MIRYCLVHRILRHLDILIDNERVHVDVADLLVDDQCVQKILRQLEVDPDTLQVDEFDLITQEILNRSESAQTAELVALLVE